MSEPPPTDPATTIAELTERIRQLEERLALVQEFTQAGVFERDPLTMQGTWDEQMYRIVGMPIPPSGTPSPEYGLLASMMLPEDRTVGGFASTFARPGVHSARVRLRRPDGRIRHLQSKWKVLTDEQGRPRRVIGVNTDDTEVFELSRRLEAAAEAARIGLWSTCDEDVTPSWNRQMFELFGLDPSGPSLGLGTWLRTVVHPEDRDALATAVLRWAGSETGPIEVEFRVRRPSDGATRWLVVRGHARERESGEGRLLEGILLDVTDQRETLDRLRDALARARLATSALGLGTWEADAEFRFGRWDEQMFRLRGVDSPPREVNHEEAASYLHPDERDAVMTGQLQRVRSAQPWSTEFRVVWPDGSVRWLASRSVPILDEAGHEIRRIGLNFDISDAKQAEQALLERERALAENRAKSRFMSRVSHELRTPLNAVLGFTQLLRDQRRAADAATRARWLEHIEDAGRHLLALIDDVLDLSAIDAGDLRLHTQAVDLRELVGRTVPLVDNLARAKAVAIEVDAGLGGWALADPVRLRQVLLNLLSNAIKYNRAGGQVRLWTRMGDGRATIAVADTGPGIACELIDRAFEPFNRLGAEATPVEGSGIGLAVAKALVERMDGRIELASSPGQGATFLVDLPAARAPAGAPAALPRAAEAADAVAGRPPARVLYIEDNAINALVMSELLAHRPSLSIEIAADGLSGLARARESRPDLLLVDLQLPDIDGIEVLRRMRAEAATAAVPCVALSANAMMTDIQEALEAGFVRYWTKPVNVDRILAEMAELLGRPV